MYVNRKHMYINCKLIWETFVGQSGYDVGHNRGTYFFAGDYNYYLGFAYSSLSFLLLSSPPFFHLSVHLRVHLKAHLMGEHKRD